MMLVAKWAVCRREATRGKMKIVDNKVVHFSNVDEHSCIFLSTWAKYADLLTIIVKVGGILRRAL